MWVVENRTPYAAERTWVRDKDGVETWVVAVKATFAAVPGKPLALADEQPPALLLPEHFGDPQATSVRAPADVTDVRPGTDVIVIDARAFAPGGRPVAETTVSVSVGPVAKSLKVVGERLWESRVTGPVPTKAIPFESVPIRYERAFGGWSRRDPDPRRQKMDPRNPVGVGVVTQPAELVGQAVPGVFYPGEAMDTYLGKARPAALGPIPPHWSPRREYGGTFDEAWKKNVFPKWPRDFDPRFHHAAPPDQASPEPLRGGEPVRLVNLTPEGNWAFELPRVYPTFETYFGREAQEHRGTLQAVLLEPAKYLVSLVFQTTLKVPQRRVDLLDKTVVGVKEYTVEFGS